MSVSIVEKSNRGEEDGGRIIDNVGSFSSNQIRIVAGATRSYPA